MIIKNLVLGGGGVAGLNMYGAIKNMIEKKYLNFDNIEKIYSVSVGALVGVIFSLKLDNKIIDEYLIKKPWHKFINIKPINILNLWKDKGIFDKTFINIIIKPLLQSKGISENITLKEFYELTKIEINMYTVNINSIKPEKIKLSYLTYPDLELCNALAMTSCVPFVFSPLYYEDKCLIDGGFINNFPLNEFLEENKDIDNIDNIDNHLLCFKIKSNNEKISITKNSNIIDYLFSLINGLRLMNSNISNSYKVKNIIELNIKNNYLEKWNEALFNRELRENLIKDGINDSDQFITEFKNSFNVCTEGFAS